MMLRNNDLVKGVAIGVGAAILIPVVIATLAPAVKPLARSALKAGIRVYEKGREKVEELGESVDDLMAEVEEEIVEAKENVNVVMEPETVTEASTEGKSDKG